MEGDNPNDVPAVTPAVASQAVDSAITSVEKAAEVPIAAISDVLSGVKSTLEGVQAELKRSNDLRELDIASANKPSEPAASRPPEVEAEPPEIPKKMVRRGLRKVSRVRSA